MAQFCAPASWPAKRLFLRPRAMGRMVRSTVLESISMRPSVKNRTNPSQYLAMYLSASPVGDLAETCNRAWSSQALNVAIKGADLVCRTTNRSGGGQFTYLRLDAVEGVDLVEPFLGNRRRAVLGQFEQFAAGMCPAVCQFDIRIGVGVKHPIVSCIAVHLQGAVKAFQNIHCMFAGSSRCVGEGHTGRVIPAPRAIITGKRPEVIPS